MESSKLGILSTRVGVRLRGVNRSGGGGGSGEKMERRAIN